MPRTDRLSDTAGVVLQPFPYHHMLNCAPHPCNLPIKHREILVAEVWQRFGHFFLNFYVIFFLVKLCITFLFCITCVLTSFSLVYQGSMG